LYEQKFYLSLHCFHFLLIDKNTRPLDGYE
jgi:hypothetical protein